MIFLGSIPKIYKFIIICLHKVFLLFHINPKAWKTNKKIAREKKQHHLSTLLIDFLTVINIGKTGGLPFNTTKNELTYVVVQKSILF
jgi:hypothetical protein